MTSNIDKKYNSGFTLIELIVTVSIVAILASIAAPSFRAMIKNNRATVEANSLVSALLLARSEAIKRKNNVTVCTSVDQESCATGSSEIDFSKGWIAFVDCDKNQVRTTTPTVDCGNGTNEAETIIKAQLGSKGMVVKRTTGLPARAHYFTYNLTGRTDSVTAFTVADEGTSTVLKDITVSLTGRIKSVNH
jgi:type IV fimbrial biogenesis protein FimT